MLWCHFTVMKRCARLSKKSYCWGDTGWIFRCCAEGLGVRGQLPLPIVLFCPLIPRLQDGHHCWINAQCEGHLSSSFPSPIHPLSLAPAHFSPCHSPQILSLFSCIRSDISKDWLNVPFLVGSSQRLEACPLDFVKTYREIQNLDLWRLGFFGYDHHLLTSLTSACFTLSHLLSATRKYF